MIFKTAKRMKTCMDVLPSKDFYTIRKVVMGTMQVRGKHVGGTDSKC